MSGNKIRVMIVDDSVLIRKYVAKIIEGFDNMEVVTTAPNGKLGLQKFYLYKPDVIILDIEMPELSGIEFLKHLEKDKNITSKPQIIMFSSLVQEGSSITFEALAHGAADFILKPDGKIADNIEIVQKEFSIKINELYRYHKKKEIKKTDVTGLSEAEKNAVVKNSVLIGFKELKRSEKLMICKPKIIVVGSSTGGPNALRVMIKNLEEIPVPMIIAQHMPPGFTTEFAKNLSSMFSREVRELSDGDILENGVIYICPGGFHSRVEKEGDDFVYRADHKDYEGFFFKPSVDILFKSAFEAAGKDILGVVLSGMGRDGSIESVNLRKAGVLMLAQDRNSSVVWGMPGNSVKQGGIDVIVDIEDMGLAINEALKNIH